jgi:hypothetical protein
MRDMTTADVCDAINLVADALDRLGINRANTKQGAIEMLAREVHDGYVAQNEMLNFIGEALLSVAQSITAVANAIKGRDA